jgi:N,N-dimethylformamidase
MLRKINHRAMAVVGYAEPWSAAAGLSRSLCLSTNHAVTSVTVRRPDRDGMPTIDWPIEALEAPPAHRSFQQGSSLEIVAEEFRKLGAIKSLSFELQLTKNAGRRVLIDAGSFSLLVEDRQLILQSGPENSSLGVLPASQWLSLHLDLTNGELSIASMDSFMPFDLTAAVGAPPPDRLCFCTDANRQSPTLNCRLARLCIVGRPGTVRWSFPTRFSAAPLPSEGQAKVALSVVGNPTFCVTSGRWDGNSLDPRSAPSHYDAIHFHDTDSAGFDWPASFAVEVPPDAESGVYAFEVTAGEAVERIAFFVTSSAAKSRLVFVAPTATYLAYANEYLPTDLYDWIGTDRGHEFARDNDLRSLYDFHSDLSGVSLTSMRKPMCTLRDDYRYPLCGDPHLLPVDLHLLRFCAREGIPVDLVTDFEVHAGGTALLQRYSAVITGSHPEYLSSDMEDSYRQFIATGGKLGYLGGNGFAATVAFKDDLMELRRGPTQAGRTWDGPLGEMALALTNEPGGYFRDRGRGEYRLVGVGISLMGFSKALPYTRTEASREPEFDWLFAGTSAETFGAEGVVLGGAAGYEVDATSPHLGSPDDIVVLATAEGFPNDYVDDPGKWFAGGASERAFRRRAEMTYWRHPSGGAVFSASSVCWCGGLPDKGAENDVGRITQNLLRHFSK